MTTAMAERPSDAVLPKDQIDLIRRTVAKDATNDELALFLYDCQRRGIHPLDKLLHFTKRGGRYTPVTSIDFMRSQAAATNEMAGSDEPVFDQDPDPKFPPRAATVTVYRLTQGQRFAYTATARWSEYCPDSAPMWKRMPHTMLGKCAEALALRKAFPQQLAGLYSREEMDQAETKSGYVVEAASPSVGSQPPAAVMSPSVPNGGESGHLRIMRVERVATRKANVTKYVIVLSDGREVTTIKEQLGALAEQIAQDGGAVTLETKDTQWGTDLTSLHRVVPAWGDEEPAPLTDADIAF